MKKRNFLFLAATSLLGLAACTSKAVPSVAPASSEEEVIDTSNMVPVFVMAGQSNMQGNTRLTPMYGGNTDYLKRYCDANGKDYNKFKNTGFEYIQHSYYGYYPYGGSINPYTSSVGSDKLSGKFVNTKAGQGLNNSCIGPELGIADVLEEHADEDKPIYLIKDAISGSGFKSQNNDKQNGMHLTWHTAADGVEEEGTKTLYDELKQYTENCLKLIEDTGKQPVIRGFLWMQGETDSDDATSATNYAEYLSKMVETFRNDFASYAFEEDGDNIAFIDALIYDGPNTQWKNHTILNDSKRAVSEESENNYLIDTTVATGIGLQLDQQENGDQYHYSMDSMMRLGNEFANIILENDLLI